jgi:acetyl-CoA C-acetyltransferase
VGDKRLIDTVIATPIDPFDVGQLGATAENLVVKWKITRDQQDALVVESHCPAA